MSLIASSSSDEPSKIIGDANKDFININIDSEKEDSETIDYNDELKPDRHLSAGVFPSLFGSDYNDLNQSDEVDYSDSEEGNISKFWARFTNQAKICTISFLKFSIQILIIYSIEDYGDIDNDTESAEDTWDSKEALVDSEYGQKKNEKEDEDIYLVPTINYETYKDESAAKKRVNTKKLKWFKFFFYQ